MRRKIVCAKYKIRKQDVAIYKTMTEMPKYFIKGKIGTLGLVTMRFILTSVWTFDDLPIFKSAEVAVPRFYLIH